MNSQEIFNTVKNHLLTQNEKSGISNMDASNKFSCKYRGPRGLKCAAGCLIPDSKYDPYYEGKCSDSVPYLNHMFGAHQTLIRQLQIVHDDSPVEKWPIKLAAVAERFCLVY